VSLFRRLRHWIAIISIWSTLGIFAGAFLSVSVPYLFGYRSLTVMSGSMEPTLHVGDVVVVSQVPPLDVRIGDIVTFRDPTDATRLITHRVRQITTSGTYVEFVTKGDANTSVEHWRVSRDGTIGRVAYHVWHLGYLMFYMRSRFGRLLLVVLPALVLGAYELWRIWRPISTPEEEDDDGNGPAHERLEPEPDEEVVASDVGS
jgi:signal peptidase